MFIGSPRLGRDGVMHRLARKHAKTITHRTRRDGSIACTQPTQNINPTRARVTKASTNDPKWTYGNERNQKSTTVITTNTRTRSTTITVCAQFVAQKRTVLRQVWAIFAQTQRRPDARETSRRGTHDYIFWREISIFVQKIQTISENWQQKITHKLKIWAKQNNKNMFFCNKSHKKH